VVATGGTIACGQGTAVRGKLPAGKNPLPGFGYISTLASGALDEVLLVVFEGCNTAATETTYGWGNLCQESVDKGADCAVGFMGDVTGGRYAEVWANAFWQSLADANTVATALAYAAELVDDASPDEGDYKGYNNWRRWNDLAIVPARFGQ
jgi:hypothetical protein